MPTHYKLHYFPVRGRGEFLKYMLEYANVPYDDIVVQLDSEWKTKTKQTFPMGVVPVLELQDGRKLSQSLAIARYLAAQHGLLSDDAFENAWGDQLACAIEDIYPPYYRPYVFATFFEKNEEKQKEAWQNMKKDGLTPMFTKFEQFLGDKEWFCGKKIHWSDFVIAEFVNRIEEIFEKGYVAAHFPRLYQHSKRVHELPRIKQYVSHRPQYPL